MLLPIRTNIQTRKTPYANYALIVINILIFLATYYEHRNPITGAPEVLRAWADQFMLTPARPYLWQFISYAFLHGSVMHIFGNMFFLYIFGNNVNDKLGTTGYLCFYLGGAVFSGIGHTIMSSSPCLGASGAVAAVTGAYLVLFPQTLITIVYWFIFIGTMELPAIYFILFKLIILDNVIIRTTPNVAYDAHLAGYAYGIAANLLLLSLGLIESSHFDLWAMIKQWNRRRKYRDVVSAGYDPFAGRTMTKRQVKVQKTYIDKQKEEKINRLKSEIAEWIAKRNPAQAADVYLELVDTDSQQVLPRQQQLDVANHLASEALYKEAANAYEKFLLHYPNYEYIEQIELMLGLIYARHLKDGHLAVSHLEKALEKLTDENQKQICKDELAKFKR